jgi:nitroreductase
MEFSDLIAQRYSVRAYRPNPVEEEKLQKVLEAARWAPTAANKQAFQILVVHTAGREDELKRIYSAEWFVKAPIVIGIVGLPAHNWVRRDGRNYNDLDLGIVMDHLILAATDVGLGTCWIGHFDPAEARAVLGLPDDAEPMAFTPLGYAADSSRPKKRKPLGDLVRYEHW